MNTRGAQGDLFTGTVSAPTAVCHICGRRLSDPKSMQMGIGPVCRGRGHTKEDAMAIHHAVYDVQEYEDHIALIDTDQGKSVTNDAENVVATLARRGYPVNDKPLIYRDTMGRWDMLLVEGGRFTDFAPLGGAKTHEEAQAALKARMETKSDAGGKAQAALAAVLKLRKPA